VGLNGTVAQVLGFQSREPELKSCAVVSVFGQDRSLIELN